MSLLIDRIKELNDKFYEACGELHENKSHIEEPHRKAVAENIFKMYELDYKLIQLKLSDIDFELEKLERKKEKLKPRTRRLWYTLFLKKVRNKAEELVEQTAEDESSEFLKDKANALKALKEALETADKADVADVLNEPKQGTETPARTIDTKTDPREASKAAKAETELKKAGQLPGQMTMDDVQAQAEPQEPTAASTTFSAKKSMKK